MDTLKSTANLAILDVTLAGCVPPKTVLTFKTYETHEDHSRTLAICRHEDLEEVLCGNKHMFCDCIVIVEAGTLVDAVNDLKVEKPLGQPNEGGNVNG